MWLLFAVVGCVITSDVLAKGVVKRQTTTLNVGVSLEPVLVSMTDDGVYQGLIPDILTALGEKLNVDWNYVDVGSDELVAQVENKTLDLAGGPLAITAESESVIDLTKPYLNMGLTMVTARPQPTPLFTRKLFLHLRPFTPAAWIFCGLCTLAVGVILYLLNRFHPKEKAGVTGQPSIEGEGRRMADSFWWVCRSFNLQGIEKRPKSIASRVVAVGWIMFVLDSLFIYLSALISNAPLYYGPQQNSPTPLPFKTINDLVKQDAFQFGSLQKYENVFVNSTDSDLSAAADSMVFLSSVEEGIERVKAGDFVFISASYIADFYTNTDCDLVAVGDLFNLQGYGFGLQTGSALMSSVNEQLLTLTEDGFIQMNLLKWSKPSDNDCAAYDEGLASAGKELPVEVVVGMDEYGGVVIGLILLLLVAIVVAIVEVLIMQRKSKTYTVEDTKDPEKQPILDEEGQAVQYEEEQTKEPSEVAEEKEQEERDEEKKQESEEKEEKTEDDEKKQESEKEEKIDNEKETDDKDAELIKMEEVGDVNATPEETKQSEDEDKKEPEEEKKDVEEEKKEESEDKKEEEVATEEKKEEPVEENEPGKEKQEDTVEEKSDPVDGEKEKSPEKDETKQEDPNQSMVV